MMEYLGLEEKAALYDLEEVSLEGARATYNEEKRPYVYGPTPFAISCTVIRNGTRDIGPPSVSRTPSELVGLMNCLAVEFPGTIVPPITIESVTEKNESVALGRANQFLEAVIRHPEVGTSKRVLEFLLHPTVSTKVGSAQLAGADVSVSAMTGRLTGSISDKQNNEIVRVLSWTKEKEILIDGIKTKALNAKKSATQAARDTASLLAAGGCLVQTALEDALQTNFLGIDAAIETFRHERARITALRTAATHTTSLFDRLAAAIQIRDAAVASYAKRQEIEALGGDKSTADALALTTASTKSDLATAEKRVDNLGPIADAARARFGREARTFIQQFPKRFSTAVDTLVEAQIAAANHLALILTEAKQPLLAQETDQSNESSELDACLAEIGAGAPSSIIKKEKKSAEEPESESDISPADPPWAQAPDKKPNASLEKDKANASKTKQPSWVDEHNDSKK